MNEKDFNGTKKRFFVTPNEPVIEFMDEFIVEDSNSET